MSDYISREAAMEIVKRTSGDYAAAFSEIRKLPAADAEPVRHGEWLRTDDDWSSLVTIQCSACGGEWCFEVDEDVQLLGYNYCPGCGCKMDLEDDNGA
jgi:hypothetical protein